jgi:hypothetical protein
MRLLFVAVREFVKQRLNKLLGRFVSRLVVTFHSN